MCAFLPPAPVRVNLISFIASPHLASHFATFPLIHLFPSRKFLQLLPRSYFTFIFLVNRFFYIFFMTVIPRFLLQTLGTLPSSSSSLISLTSYCDCCFCCCSAINVHSILKRHLRDPQKIYVIFACQFMNLRNIALISSSLLCDSWEAILMTPRQQRGGNKLFSSAIMHCLVIK